MGGEMTAGGEDRRRLILVGARDVGQVEISEAAARLGVSVETIRRDIKLLEEQGLVTGALTPSRALGSRAAWTCARAVGSQRSCASR